MSVHEHPVQPDGPGTLDQHRFPRPGRRSRPTKWTVAIRTGLLGLNHLLLFQHIVHIDPEPRGEVTFTGTAMVAPPDAWLRKFASLLDCYAAITRTTASGRRRALGN